MEGGGGMLLGGKSVFPITLGNGPPVTGKDPQSGLNGWTEVARAGVKMLRVYPKWDAANAAEQIQTVKELMIAAASRGLRLWVGLYNVANDLSRQALLGQIVDGLKDSPGLGAWKGADEPLWGNLDSTGLAAAYEFIRSRDPSHPIVIIQAPKARDKVSKRERPLTAGLVKPYAAAGDIHGVDIYPISHPPGTHAGRPNKDISVVGDVTAIVAQAAPGREHWATLQVVQELNSDSVGPALVAPPAPVAVKANAADVRLVARQAGGFLYLIVVRRSPTANGPVRFTGLPTGIKFGAAMFEYDGADFRTFRVTRGTFTDPFAPHDARVYRFRLRR
jgi:hypothetical protein